MPLIIVGLPFRKTWPQGQNRLRTIQRLDLAFLIDTEHQSLLRRVRQTNNVAHFVDKLRISTELKVLNAVRLQVIRLPYPLNRSGTDTLAASHRSHRPVRPILRFGISCHLYDLGFLLCTDPRRTPRPWLVLQNASQAIFLVSPPPQQHGGQSCRKLPRQLPIGHSLGSFQDNLTAKRYRLRGTRITNDLGQFELLCRS